MRKRKKNLRVYLVGCLFVVATVTLWVRLVQVQVFGRSAYAEAARRQGEVKRNVPPSRGGIFDRNGRPLALSIRSCSISIHPRDVKNRSEVASVLSRHLNLSSSVIRKKLRSTSSFVWVKRQCSLSEKQRKEIRALAGVDVRWEADRVYPYGRTANKIVGFIGHDNTGMAGIEAAFDKELAGAMGWEVVQIDGAYRSRGYQTYAQQKPRDGKHVVLTIDVRLQELTEHELERTVKATNAKSGGLIVMHCETGDILALAEFPSAASRAPGSLADSMWTIRSISWIYEPGSTFKLITAGALLETKKVRSFDVFDAENGRAVIGRATISDSHPHGHLTFREGFVFSSNIVMAKASLNLSAREFFEFVRLFGFGARTGVRLLGESPGRVAPVEQWSRRTQITMAFGQEIAVTPLQMINAFAAVANEGVLMTPRIVKSVVDENTGRIDEFEPVRVRRVISKDTSRRLRDFCRSVVEEGTGTKAEVSFVAVSGKTGTAEKATRNGYLRDKFIASFIGFAPHEDPKIVCLIMLDEPDYYYRFGGVSAAPLFARVNEAIAYSSSFYDGVLTHDVIEDARLAPGPFKAPNFLRLDRARAMERARKLGLNVLCKGEEGEVVSQDPDPGVAMNSDDVIRLYLNGRVSKPSGARTPDLRGLPMRLAKRRAVEAGFRCDIVGTGFVASQRPEPGKTSKNGVVRVYCNDKARNDG
ncbi:MAG: penicillin-binding transpeptidase domain-containing protein [Candidatus Krumholzibacteria bacterium]